MVFLLIALSLLGAIEAIIIVVLSLRFRALKRRFVQYLDMLDNENASLKRKRGRRS